MRFLADESCDFAVVRALRSEGHDVSAVSEFQQRSVDHELMRMAHAEGRILLTEDKDFGWLTFVAHMNDPGLYPDPFSGHGSTHVGGIGHAISGRVRSTARSFVRRVASWFGSHFQDSPRVSRDWTCN